MSERRVPSIGRVMSADRSVALGNSFALVAFGFGILALVVGKVPRGRGRWTVLTPSETRSFLLLVVGLVLLLAVANFLRIRAIRGMFENGVRAQAEILRIQVFKSGAKRFGLRFETADGTVETHVDVMKNHLAVESEGDWIDVVYDSAKPKKVLPVEAFISEYDTV